MSATMQPRPTTMGMAGLATLAGMAALVLLFWHEGQSAVQVWIASTAYGHCFFIVPIALFLAWERRDVARATPIVPMPGLALAAIPLALLWLAAERLGIMEGQQLLAMAFVELMFLALLGWRMFKALAVPMLYLGFLVPFGAFVTPALQHYTAWFINVGLDVIGVPNVTDGNLIEIPEGNFFVAEACAGLRFLIASIAFGVLYACMIYRSLVKRVVFIAAAVIIPVVANGFRGLGIVWLGHVLGSAEAVEVDHVLYGWIFFSIVIVILILVGLPFREDAGPLPVPDYGPGFAAPAPARLWGTLALLLGLAALAPGVAQFLDHRAAAGSTHSAAPVALAGCRTDPTGTAQASSRQDFSYICAGETLRLRISVFSPRITGGAIIPVLREVTGELAAEDVTQSSLLQAENAVWRLISVTEPDRQVATALWIDGRPAVGGIAQRMAMALHSVVGGAPAPVLVTLTEASPSVRLSETQRSLIRSQMLGLIGQNPGFAAAMAALARDAGDAAGT